MNSVRLVASRYAQALAETVTDDSGLDTVRQNLRQLATMIVESEEFRRALANPVIPPESKTRVVTEVARRAGMSGKTTRFLEVIGQRDRLVLLPEIAAEIEREYNRRIGVHEVEISCAEPLDDDQRNRISRALERTAGGRIKLSESVDPELLGGVVAKIGTTVFDASLRTKLENLRTRMMGQGGSRVSG